MTELGVPEFFKLAIFYGSYLSLPVAIFLVWVIRSCQGYIRLSAIILLFLTMLFVYARFIEPRILLTVHHRVNLEACYDSNGQIKVAVFSDTHNGLFAHAMPIHRIVKAIEKNSPDAILIPGDLTYFLHPERYQKTYAALSQIDAPVYAVLGNHDVGFPGPDMSESLIEFFPALGVKVIDNLAATIPKGFELIGLSDSWQGRQKLELLFKKKEKPRIVLTHNPETIWELTKGSFDLLIAGHTHGGQVNLPIITCKLAFIACTVNRYGYKILDEGPVFVTSGTGMVGLPLRFRVPPVVDIVTIEYEACSR